MQKNILCRVCATTETASVLVDLFDKPGERACAAEMILELTGLTVTFEDGLPQDCCIQCYTDLLKGVNVRRKCIETDQTLRSAIEASMRVIEDGRINDPAVHPIKEEEKEKPFLQWIKVEENIPSVLSGEQDENEAEDSSTDTASTGGEEQDNPSLEADPKCRSIAKLEQEHPAFHCNECSIGFDGSKNLKQHYETIHANAIHGWESFGVTAIDLFDSTDEEQEDYEEDEDEEYRPRVRRKPKSPESNFRCCGCKEVFDTKAELQQHSEQVHAPNAPIATAEKPFKCNICHQLYTTRVGLRGHQRIQSEMRFLCSVCGQLKSALCLVQYHEEYLHKNLTFPCPDCGKGFVMEKLLQAHRATRHTDLQRRIRYSCDICGKRLLSKASLKKHCRALHLTETPYACSICDAQFKLKASLTAHITIHKRLFPCLECGKAFQCAAALLDHMPSHTGIRNVSCTLCPAKFRRKQCLAKHMRTVHDATYVRKRKYGIRNITRINTGDATVSRTTEQSQQAGTVTNVA